MSHNSHGGMSGRCQSTITNTPAPSSQNEKVIRQSPNSSPILSKAFPDSTYVNPSTTTFACPVLGCTIVFEGDMPDGYLWRHLGRPGAGRRTGDEKAAWLDLHKIERDRLLATRITPAQRRRKANRMKAKMLRTAEFELRAKNIGITEKELVAQKVKIWEGMWVAKQNGDSIVYDAWLLLDFSTGP